MNRLLEATEIGSRIGIKYRPKVKTSRQTIWKEILAFGLPLLTWLLFSSLYFGNPIPHSIAAKSMAYHLNSEEAFVRLLQHYSTPFMGNLTFGNWWIAVGMVANLFFYFVGAWYGLRNDPRNWVILTYPWLYFLIFSIANPLIFRWYLTPPLPAYILTILIGIDRFSRQILNSKRSSPGKDEHAKITGQMVILTIILVVLIPSLLISQGWTLHPDHGANRPAPEMSWYKLELLYQQASEILSSEMGQRNSSPVLAAGDVGVLGYFTSAYILDTVGLNSPISTQYYPLDEEYYTINYAIPPKLILDQLPDYLVILEVYGRDGLLNDTNFQHTYTLLKKIPTDIYGSDGMLIFKRDY